MRLLLLLILLLLAGCVGGAVRTTTTGSIGSIELARWPEADALFRGDPLWLGGEGGYTIDLGAGRVLWLFGNSFIAGGNVRDRGQSTLVRNSVAIQSGYDPSRAKIRFDWKRGGS